MGDDEVAIPICCIKCLNCRCSLLLIWNFFGEPCFALDSMRPVVFARSCSAHREDSISVDVEHLASFEVEDAGCYLMYRSFIPCGFGKAVQQAEALMITVNK